LEYNEENFSGGDKLSPETGGAAMTARDSIRAGLGRLRAQARRTGRVQVSASALALGAEAGIHFLLAAVLAGAVVLGGRAPFGVALVAAAGSGVCGGAALVGACFGSLAALDFSAGLRYVSASILTFATAFAFYDWKLLRRPWTMPAVAALFTGFTGFIVQSRAGWRAEDVIRFTLEVVLTAAACWCYRAALLPMRSGREERTFTLRRGTGLLVLLCTVLAALSPVELLKEISLGRVLAVLAVALCAWLGGTAAGAVAGVAAGATLDLAAAGTPLYTMACGVAGLAAGLCRGKPRYVAAPVCFLSLSASVLWLWGDRLPLSVVYEGLFGCVAFLLLPRRLTRRFRAWFAPAAAGPAERRTRRLVQRKLESTSQAFRALCESLRGAVRPPENDNDVASVFDRTAGRVCRKCALRDRCWKQEYTTTFNALNDATPAMVERGRAAQTDFPRHFSDRCLHFQDFLTAVNEELTALFYRRQYSARVRENRAAVCRQYAQLSDLLGSAAAELSEELSPDPAGDRRVRARAAELGLDVRTAVFRNSRGLLQVEAEGPGCGVLAKKVRVTELSSLLGVPLRVEREGEEALTLLQEEPLMAVAGVAARKKSGETVSGDAGTYFKRSDGKLYVLLCDGMGSGPEANRESSLAVRLLEQFLQAGVEAAQALSTLSSALALRGEDTGGFTTVDLLQVDLFTGGGELFKLGAAPTYIRKGTRVQRLAGSSLPAGLAEGTASALDRFPLSLEPGDTVLMISDGVASPEDDGWLRDKLQKFDGESPKDLARELICDSPQDATDDRTALVIRIGRR